MVRGVIPRRPAKTGRHEGARTVSRGQQSRGPSRQPKHASDFRPGKGPRQKSKPKREKAYNPLAPERIQEILKRLDHQYPDVTCALQHKTAWEFLVATILSAQVADVRVNMVTPEIFKKYPTLQYFAALTLDQLPRDRWTLFSHQIIWHGRKLCTARSPKCAECPLENICHAADKTWTTVEIHKNVKP